MTTALAKPEQNGSLSPMSLLEVALEKDAAIDVIERLAKLQMEMMDRQAKADFDDALNDCQSQIGRIAPNQKRENNIGWADYAQLDRTVRPIYIKSGFSIGFSEAESNDPGRLRMRATVSKSGISREYFAEISRTPANSKMNQLDADASAASRVKRYLMLSIFNIAVGIDKEEKQGIPVSERDEAELQTWADALSQAPDLPQLKSVFADAYKFAKRIGEPQKVAMMQVYEDCKRRLI